MIQVRAFSNYADLNKNLESEFRDGASREFRSLSARLNTYAGRR